MRLFTKRGFTLIELLIAISIIAIISAIGLVTYSQSQIIARDARRKQDLRSIATALELYRQTNKHYPCSSANLYSLASADWQKSNSASDPWIIDAPAPCSTTPVAFDINYINKVPRDPKADAGNPISANVTGYSYWSGLGATAPCPTAPNQYYVLAAGLENSNDPDANGTTHKYKYCDDTALSIQANVFIITSQ